MKLTPKMWGGVFGLPIIILLMVMVFIPLETIDLLKDSKQKELYTDGYMKGNSEGEIQKTTEEEIKLKYTLKNGINYPFVGMKIFPPTPFLKKDYHELSIQIYTPLDKKIPINLSVPNYPLKNNRKVELLFHTHVNAKSGHNTFQINLSEFEIPTWWYTYTNCQKTDLTSTEEVKIHSVNIQSGINQALINADEIVVRKIVLKQNWWQKVRLWLILIVGVELLFLVVFFLQKSQKPKKIEVSYQPRETVTIADDELEQVLVYLSSNYHEAITLSIIAKDLGISQRKISTLIKEKLGKNLKTLINEIRINESKRLLQESDMTVNEVADTVGFGNISHFYRVFKSELDMSPSQFRNQKKE